MNNPDHISECLETIFWVKIPKFFDAYPVSGMEKIRIRDKHPGSATLIKRGFIFSSNEYFWLSPPENILMLATVLKLGNAVQ
jgi:hypothetical protein